MAASEHGDDAVIRTTQLVQYEDVDENDEKRNLHSDYLASVRVDEGGRGYQGDDGIEGGAREDSYMGTSFREGMVAQQTHTGVEGSDSAAEAMRVFCAYETVATVGESEETQGGVRISNEYSEEDGQEKGMNEVVLEERVHGDDQSPGYLPEEAGRGEEHSSFSSMQQLQLRAQILVYGDLIKGVLPEQSLMSSAFSDEVPNEVTEQESDRISGGWNWEGPWRLALDKEAERREAERLVEEERINSKGDVIMTEGDVVNAGADNLEPGTPSTSPIRVSEDNIKEEGLQGAMPETGDTADHLVAGLDDLPADVDGVPSGLGVNLDAVVENIVAATVNSIDSSLLKDAAAEAQVTRSPSLDPWLKPPSQTTPVPSNLAWQTPVETANVGLGGEATSVDTLAVMSQFDVAEGLLAGDPSTVTESVEPEEGSRKRKSRVREKKTPAVSKATTPIPSRSRGRNASAGKSTTPATISPRVVPSRLLLESSEVAPSAQVDSPASLGATISREAQGKSNLHADTQSWLEQAKASFEEAVSTANSAAEQVQFVNSITTTLKSGKEAQLASAAAAVNAAASVAKAAAEAAKVAYEAALQASIIVSDGVDISLGKFVVGNGQGDKDGGLGGRRSAIAAAKEEARKRATANTPSAKPTPQTTDAVLRAARLMAEAASQAGAVLAKGNFGTPLTLPPSPVSQLDLRRSGGRNRSKKETTAVKSPESMKPTELDSSKHMKGSMKKGARRRGKELQELAATNSCAQKGSDGQAKLSPHKATRRQLDQVMSTATEVPEILEQSQIMEGSLIEVMNDEEGLRGGWFSAKVLQLRTGEAYVQYDEILTDDGTTQLKEWFPLEGRMEGTEPGRPRIRVISPNNIAKDEGRRKRRKTTTGQKVWSAGARVDAFAQDGWWEGVVKAVDEDDESKITVYFPGEGDTSVVKSWNLRPSFIWKDGRWEQWTRSALVLTNMDELHQSKKQKVSESPKVQARKSGRGKSTPAGKVSDETTEHSRASRRSKLSDTQSSNPVSPPITTRSSPRQKLPPKRKEGPTEVSTPTQVSTSVSTRTRSITQDAVNPVTEPLTRSAPSRTKSPLSPEVEKSENQLKESVASRKLRNSELIASEEKKTRATRQKASSDVAKPVTRRSARL